MLRRGALLCGAALAFAGCGAMPAQDENEPEGEFPVRVDATFPKQQSLAKDSQLRIEVTNAGEREIPNVNVTVDGFSRKLRDPLDPAAVDPGVADPGRPVFVVDRSPVEFLAERPKRNKSLVDREVGPPQGADRRGSAYVNTYSLGALPAGETAVFRWDLSAVEAGPYELEWNVNAGLDGNAIAVGENGDAISGTFEGEIASTPPATEVSAENGRSIVRNRGPGEGGPSGAIFDGD